jgi:hypothetical protein
VLISSKDKNGGAAASINTLAKSYSEMKQRDIPKEYMVNYPIGTSQASAKDIMDGLLISDEKEPLKVLSEAYASKHTVSIYTVLNLSVFAIEGFENENKLKLENIFDEIRGARVSFTRSPENINFFREKKAQIIEALSTITDQELLNVLSDILTADESPNGLKSIMYGVVGAMSKQSAKIVSNSALAKPISDLIRDLLVRSSLMQINAKYKKNKLTFKLIHPITISEGLIKLDGEHNFRTVGAPKGGIAFKLP